MHSANHATRRISIESQVSMRIIICESSQSFHPQFYLHADNVLQLHRLREEAGVMGTPRGFLQCQRSL